MERGVMGRSMIGMGFMGQLTRQTERQTRRLLKGRRLTREASLEVHNLGSLLQDEGRSSYVFQTFKSSTALFYSKLKTKFIATKGKASSIMPVLVEDETKIAFPHKAKNQLVDLMQKNMHPSSFYGKAESTEAKQKVWDSVHIKNHINSCLSTIYS